MKNSKDISLYEKIKNEIIYLDLEPGTAIGEIETSQRFNISRTPVRDVFKRLSQEGLIEIKPHIGTFVALIDIDRISDTLFVREKIEQAVLKDLVNKLSPSQLVRLQVIISKQELLEKNFIIKTEEDKKHFAQAFLDLDDEFHKTIFEFAGKLGVWNYLFSNEQHYKRFRIYLNIINNGNVSHLIEDHKVILTALSNNNIAEIETIFSNHIYDGIKRLSSSVYEIKYFKK